MGQKWSLAVPQTLYMQSMNIKENKQMRFATTVILATFLLVACAPKPDARPIDDDAAAEPDTTTKPESPDSADTPSESDFATPQAAVATMIKAASAQNADLLSRCFADTAAEEFNPFRKKTATADQLSEFAQFVDGAAVLDEDISEDGNSASVAVKFEARDETIELTKSKDGWKVVDF